MGYDQELTDLIARIQADKQLVQPWRNYAAKEAHVLQALLRMGRTTTHLVSEEYSKMLEPINKDLATCICKPGLRIGTCPASVHVA